MDWIRQNDGELPAYLSWLREQERSEVTIEKYLRDVRHFLRFLGPAEISKELVVSYKQSLIDQGYAARSINSMLAAVNSYLSYLGKEQCRVRAMKTQRQIYRPESRELTKEEYLRLLAAAKKKPRLYLLLQTISGTGIRVSELRYFTVEAVKAGEIQVSAKGKLRPILLPTRLRTRLLAYAREERIRSGPIFRTRTGRPLDRSNIWAEMKALCARAKVEAGKVFPHNLRKLFARTYYAVDRDLAKLADLLGHSSIETTRIYIMGTGAEHRRQLEKLGLVV